MKAASIRGLLIAFATLILAAPSYAQEATFTGTATDSTGSVLPGVTITAVNDASGNVFTTVTDERGEFRMPVRVGVYTIKAELVAFGAFTKEGVRLGVGESAILNFTLKLATVAESITVTGEAPLVDTKKSELSGRVEQKQVENLPLNGRNWLDLVALVPGARGNIGSIQVGASGSDHHRRPSRGEHAREAVAQPARRASDEGDTPVEPKRCQRVDVGHERRGDGDAHVPALATFLQIPIVRHR